MGSHQHSWLNPVELYTHLVFWEYFYSQSIPLPLFETKLPFLLLWTDIIWPKISPKVSCLYMPAGRQWALQPKGTGGRRMLSSCLRRGKSLRQWWEQRTSCSIKACQYSTNPFPNHNFFPSLMSTRYGQHSIHGTAICLVREDKKGKARNRSMSEVEFSRLGHFKIHAH